MMSRGFKGFILAVIGGVIIFAGIKYVTHDITRNLMIISGACLAAAGLLIVLFLLSQRNSYLAKTLADIDNMNGKEFEDYLCLLFTGLGYTVVNTRASHDFGADLILTQNGQTIAVQAKRYNKKIPIDAVQECAAARRHYNTDEAWIVTNNYFTQSALDLSLSNEVKLISRNELADLIRTAQKAKLSNN